MLRYNTCYTRDHTVLPATKHEPYLPLLPIHRASPPFGRYSLRLPTEGWPGWVDLGGWLDWDKFPALGVEPDTVTHPSTKRAPHRATSLIWPTSLRMLVPARIGVHISYEYPHFIQTINRLRDISLYWFIYTHNVCMWNVAGIWDVNSSVGSASWFSGWCVSCNIRRHRVSLASTPTCRGRV